METLIVTTEKQKEINAFLDRVHLDVVKDFNKHLGDKAVRASKKKLEDFYLIYRMGAFCGLRYSTDRQKRFLRKARRGEI